jgi:transcriptional regulator with XRE-family HTH domain
MRLKSARLAKGYSLQDLAGIVNVSKQMLSKYETEKSFPSSKNLIEISKALGVSTDHFFRSPRIDPSGLQINMSSGLTQKISNEVEGTIIDHLEKLYEIESILTPLNGSIEDFNDLKKNICFVKGSKVSAEYLRQKWELGKEPIRSVTRMLESKQINVVETGILENFYSASSFYRGNYPVIAVNSGLSDEVKRFRLLYELGRLIAGTCGGYEEYCKSFALNMLMPSCSLKWEYGDKRKNIGIYELSTVAEYYGVTLEDMLFRMIEDGIVMKNSDKVKSMKITEKVESDLVHKNCFIEKPDRLKRLVYKALSYELITIGKAALILNESVRKIRKETSQIADI